MASSSRACRIMKCCNADLGSCSCPVIPAKSALRPTPARPGRQSSLKRLPCPQSGHECRVYARDDTASFETDGLSLLRSAVISWCRTKAALTARQGDILDVEGAVAHRKLRGGHRHVRLFHSHESPLIEPFIAAALQERQALDTTRSGDGKRY